MKKDMVNLIPILYLLIPIIIGIINGAMYKKINFKETIQQFAISVIICTFYLTIIAFYTSSQGESMLLLILLIWNSVLIFLTSKVYLIIFKK